MTFEEFKKRAANGTLIKPEPKPNYQSAIPETSNMVSNSSTQPKSGFGNVLGKTVATPVAALGQLGTGVMQGLEGALDFGASIGVTGINSMRDQSIKGMQKDLQKLQKQGNFEAAARLQKVINQTQSDRDYSNKIAEDFIGKQWVQDYVGNSVDQFTEQYSYLPVKAGQIVKTVGNMLPSIANAGSIAKSLPQATTKLGQLATKGATMLPFMAQAAGSSTEQALNEGANLADATKYGLASGVLEGAIESISGGIGGSVGGKVLSSKLGKEAIERIAKNSLGKFALRLADAGIDVAGEGFEEVLSTAINPLIQRMTYDEQAKLATSEEMMQSFIDGALASLLVKGGQAGLSRAVNRNNANVQENEVQNQAQTQNIEQGNATLPTQAEMAQNANMEQMVKNVENDTMKFSKQVDDLRKNNFNRQSELVVLQNTPQILLDLGLDNYPITIKPSKLETIYNDTAKRKKDHPHDLGELVKEIPEALKRPLNVVESVTRPGSIVVVTDLADKNGDIVVVSINPNDKGQLEIDDITTNKDVNKLTSAYGKREYDYIVNKKTGEYEDGWMELNQRNDKILYDIDEGIIKKRINGQWLQSPNVVKTLSNNSINQNDLSVNTEYAQNNKNDTADAQSAFSMPKNKLSTQAEQRSKLRNFYQTAQEGSMVDKGYIKDIRKNKEQFEYNPISNQETLTGARSKVNEDSLKAERDFLAFNGEGLNADDVAVAEVLIADAIAKGDKSKANYLTATLAEKLTQAGQAIQATKIFKRMTPEGMILYAQKEINKINRDLEKDNPKLYKKLKDEGALPKLDDSDIEKITEYMQEAQNYSDDYWNTRQKDRAIAKALSVVDNKVPSSVLDKIASVRRSGLLFNIKTLMRNLGSNISFGTLEAFKDIPATGIDKLTSLITGERTTTLPNSAYWRGAKKGAAEGIEDVRDNIKTAGKDSKYELPKKTFKRTDTYKDIANTFKSGEIKEGTKKAFRRALSDYEDASMYIVEGTDRPFWQGRFESELANQMKLKGLEYGIDTPTTEMLESAQKSADYATFKNKNKVSETFGKIKRVLNGGKPIGVADVLGFTFTNVPGSVATKAFDYSPAGVITTAKELYNAIRRNGKFDQRNFVDSLSRALVGTSGWALGAYLIGQGIIRGAADDDDDKASAEKQMGLQENSLNISALERLVKGEDTTLQKGDKFYSFDWLQPAASPFLIGSDIYKAKEEGENPAFAGAKSAVNQIADMSSLSQVSKLFKGYSGSDMFENVAKVVGEFPSSFIPTIWNNAGQFTDEYKRVSYDATDAYFKTNVNKVLAKIPGLRTTLEKQIDTFGNEQKQYKGGNDFWSTFINPGYNSTYDPTPLQEEILRVYNETGDKGVFPITAASSVTYKNEATKLNPKQRMTYQKASGEYVTQILAGLIESNAYKNFDDTQKATVLKEVIADSNTLGKAAVGLKTKTYDDYMKKINQLGNVPLADYYNSYVAQKGIESDKDALGKTIENSKSIKVKAAIDNATPDISTSQRKVLYDIFNVSKTVQEGKTTKSSNMLPTLKTQSLNLPSLKNTLKK